MGELGLLDIVWDLDHRENFLSRGEFSAVRKLFKSLTRGVCNKAWSHPLGCSRKKQGPFRGTCAMSNAQHISHRMCEWPLWEKLLPRTGGNTKNNTYVV